MPDTTQPEIISVSGYDDFFYIKYRQGKREWIVAEPYTEELYKELVTSYGYA